MRKYQVVNLLAAVLDLRNLLEISTPTTGQTFQEALASGNYRRADRIVYGARPGFSDGLPITLQTTRFSSWELTRHLLADPKGATQYDVVFIDPHHTYYCSMTDLLGAWLLLRPGGVMVVHDCNPPRAELTAPHFVEGAWCGVTYQAFVDFGLSGLADEYFTVDADFGVGVAWKGSSVRPSSVQRTRDPLATGWRKVRDRDAERFEFFSRHRTVLLRLVDEGWFIERYAGPILGVGEAGV